MVVLKYIKFMSINYLKFHKTKIKNGISCVLTSNIDEDYSKIYPIIKKNSIVKLISQYPDNNYDKIKVIIKKQYNIVGDIVFGSGSEELIIRLNDLAEEQSFKMIFITPIFYRVRETFYGQKIDINEDKLFNFNYSNYDVVWLQNPNLFSGKIYLSTEIELLLNKFPNILFFIDEAGIFTLSDWKKYSMLDKSHKFKNLIVISTFSKMYGLSGLRIGFVSGNLKILSKLEEKNLTFPISSIAEKYLIDVLKNERKIEKMRLKIEKHKKQLTDIIECNSEIIVNKSMTNCIFLKHKKIDIYKFLLKNGLLCLNLDYCKELKNRGYVRMTVYSSSVLQKRIVKLLNKIKIYEI